MSSECARAQRAAAQNRQRGVAAVEFALVFVILFSVLYGIATFGAVLYTQQAVTRAAEDGARAASLLVPTPIADDTRVKDAVYDALANSLIVPTSANTNVASRRSWIVSQVNVIVAAPSPSGIPGANASCVVTVTYPYRANRLLPSMLVIDSWVPENLKSHAAAALAS